MFAQFLDTSLCLFEAFASLEKERLCNDSDNEDALHHLVIEFDALGYFGDNRCCTGTCAAAHASGDEEHLSVVGDGLTNLVFMCKSHLASVAGHIACSKFTKHYLVGHRTGFESLCIGIADDEFDAMYTLTVHVVDGIAATSANSNDLDLGGTFVERLELHSGDIWIDATVQSFTGASDPVGEPGSFNRKRKCAIFHITYF